MVDARNGVEECTLAALFQVPEVIYASVPQSLHPFVMSLGLCNWLYLNKLCIHLYCGKVERYLTISVYGDVLVLPNGLMVTTYEVETCSQTKSIARSVWLEISIYIIMGFNINV
jgi:hypothetical protein